MIKAYNYLYFSIYKILLKTIDKDFAEYTALFVLSTCVALDVFLISLPFRHSLYPHVSTKSILIVLYISIALLNYYHFVRSKKYLELAEVYKNASPKKIKTMGTVAIIFCVFHVVGPILLGILIN
jgi:hypothetical protein